MQKDYSREAYDMARDAMAKVNEHERVCAERYNAINGKLSYMSTLLTCVAGSGFVILLSVVGYLISKHGV